MICPSTLYSIASPPGTTTPLTLTAKWLGEHSWWISVYRNEVDGGLCIDIYFSCWDVDLLLSCRVEFQNKFYSGSGYKLSPFCFSSLINSSAAIWSIYQPNNKLHLPNGYVNLCISLSTWTTGQCSVNWGYVIVYLTCTMNMRLLEWVPNMRKLQLHYIKRKYTFVSPCYFFHSVLHSVLLSNSSFSGSRNG